MELTQFYNCRILRNHQIIDEDLWVRSGKIENPEKIFFDEKIQADKRIDCKGCIICPGFIELQINGGYGHDFSFTNKIEEALNKVSKELLSHGVTAYCPTLVTSPKEIYHQVLPKLSFRQGGTHGATVLGAHVEGPYINKEKKGAHPPECILDYDQDIKETYGSLNNVRIITLAPELVNSSKVIKMLSEKNIAVSLGHSIANLSQGEEAFKNGAVLVTHLFNAMLPFHHRDPGLVGLLTSNKIPDDKPVYFGIISDGIHTHPAALRIAFRVHPQGLVLVTDAISALGLSDGEYTIGQMKVEVVKGKAFIAGTTTLCGSTTTMIECVRIFKQSTECSLEYALEAASLHPARALGIEKIKGTLDYGTDADFVILNDNLEIQSTWILGSCVYKSKLNCC